jgi:hypothetical protein
MISNEIVQIARSYVGQRELPNNSGFKDPSFLKKMQAVGFYPGASWCCFFFKLVWMEGYEDSPAMQKLINRYANGSTRETYKNFKASPEFKVRDYPVVGAGVIWQHGSGTTGHAGVVTQLISTTGFKSVEGNTNSTGGREGIEVYEQPLRKLGQPHTETGLNILGFIHPIEL